jgi:hypothetical protein
MALSNASSLFLLHSRKSASAASRNDDPVLIEVMGERGWRAVISVPRKVLNVVRDHLRRVLMRGGMIRVVVRELGLLSNKLELKAERGRRNRLKECSYRATNAATLASGVRSRVEMTGDPALAAARSTSSVNSCYHRCGRDGCWKRLLYLLPFRRNAKANPLEAKERGLRLLKEGEERSWAIRIRRLLIADVY